MYEKLVALLRKKYDKAPMVMEAADAIEELSKAAEVNAKRAMKWAADAEKAEKAQRWIPVTERLPDEKQAEDVLCWIPVTEEPLLKVGDDGYNGYLVYANGYYAVADHTTDKFDNVPYFHVNGEYEPTVTHYMPLPEPPKDEAPTGPYDLLYEEGGANTT